MTTTRNIYLVDIGDFDYDEYDSFVIVADSQQDAIQIAIAKGGGKFRAATIRPIGTTTTEPEGVILGSFNAG